MLDIALAVYNGARYLPELLTSLDAQSEQRWKLIARDDGSSDESPRILSRYALARGEAAEIIPGDRNVGIVRNFSLLLERSRDSYVMLADQDDVWYPDKVATSLAAIRRLETENGSPDIPALVFTDLHVVDAERTLINKSFVSMRGLRPLVRPYPTFSQLLTQNVAPGCSMIANRALLDRALPIPGAAEMHDWWLIQVAALFGRVAYVDQATLAYRQHGANEVGAAPRKLGSAIWDLVRGGARYRERVRRAQMQAGALLERYGRLTSGDKLETARAFATLPEHLPVRRQWIAYRQGLSKAGLARNVVFYMLM